MDFLSRRIKVVDILTLTDDIGVEYVAIKFNENWFVEDEVIKSEKTGNKLHLVKEVQPRTFKFKGNVPQIGDEYYVYREFHI